MTLFPNMRKPLYYVINLITPTSIITLISIVGFFSCSSINELREEKISLGITTLLSMSILIFMVSDKMPSTSSFIPLIGWFYTCMILLISFSTLLSSVIIYVQKQGILGKPPRKETMRWARVVGRFVRMEIPLLMRQAYAQKAREERLRKTQRQRKESLWQKVYKLSKSKENLKSNSSPKTVHVNAEEDNITMEKTRKSLNISTEVLKINGTHAIPEYTPMGDVDLDEDTSYIDDDKEDLDFPPSKFLHKTSTCQSLESALRIGVTFDPTTPRTARNLAELEFDWLAAVIERVCLIVFIFFFILMSFGINSIGLYYWWTAKVSRER
ncbi:unnamed protein product, partial [Mesorhabditis belari]|uniref:Neurotransmitter-gated ion-channel transmembrane domain-containing protein n=1 Tax=Mesorhabditis belari TaxID=2138241 RepID=A0AAF3F7D3_9BILA